MLSNSTALLSRSPEVQLIANGLLMDGVIAAGVRSTRYFGADCFDLTLALGSDGPFWSDEPSIDIDLRVRQDTSSSYVSLIKGRVDLVHVNTIARVVQIEGRDYSAGLIDSVLSESFSNRTASEIATLLAQRHNLQPLVAPTSTIVGRYYQSGYETVLLDNFCGRASEWDLLSYLAQHEGYELFVCGTDLHFTPASNPTIFDEVLSTEDVMELRLERMLPFAGDVEVIVKTWNSREHSSDVQTARRAGSAGNGTSPRRYVVVQPNLRSDAAQQLAQRRLAELCAHGSTIDLVMPGELSLMPRSVIMLTGTGTTFDQAYRIDLVDRRMSSKSGFTQRIRATRATSPAIAN